MTVESVLSLRHVSKYYGERKALNLFCLDLYPGQCVALLGPNGAGKSTTLKLALGLAAASEGTITALGCNMPDEGHLARQRIGVVAQEELLDPDFTSFENLCVFGSYFGLSGDELQSRSSELIEFAGLGSRSTEAVRNLSGGMRRRLSLARALINSPDLLFLDEPTTSLDPHARHLIWDRLRQLKQQGMSLVLTTHFMDEAQRLADHVLVLDQGSVVAQGSPNELISKYVASNVVEVWGTPARGWIQKLEPSSLHSADRGRDVFFMEGDVAERMLGRLQSIRPEGVGFLFRPGNLEDVFFKLTGRALGNED